MSGSVRFSVLVCLNRPTRTEPVRFRNERKNLTKRSKPRATSSHYFPFQQLGHTISNSIFCFPFTQSPPPLRPGFRFWTSKHSLSFRKSITRDKKSGLPISNHVLELFDSVDIAATDMSATSFTDTSML